jgi:hypothetical protein
MTTKMLLTTPFNRYNSSNRFPLFELGDGVSAGLCLEEDFDLGVDDISSLLIQI